MKAPTLRARIAAVAGAVLVTLAHVWLIANYAYPNAETGTLVVGVARTLTDVALATTRRWQELGSLRADFDFPMSRIPAPTSPPWRLR
jgi:uncharacterized membrane protein